MKNYEDAGIVADDLRKLFADVDEETGGDAYPPVRFEENRPQRIEVVVEFNYGLTPDDVKKLIEYTETIGGSFLIEHAKRVVHRGRGVDVFVWAGKHD